MYHWYESIQNDMTRTKSIPINCNRDKSQVKLDFFKLTLPKFVGRPFVRKGCFAADACRTRVAKHVLRPQCTAIDKTARLRAAGLIFRRVDGTASNWFSAADTVGHRSDHAAISSNRSKRATDYTSTGRNKNISRCHLPVARARAIINTSAWKLGVGRREIVIARAVASRRRPSRRQSIADRRSVQ